MCFSLLIAGWTTLAHASAEQTQTFTYEGQLLDASGTSPLTGTVDFTFTIYNPTEDCLLYEESQTGFDFTASNGRFSVLIGSTAGNAKRTASDPGLNMSDVFRNDGTSIRASSTPNCTPGYAATAGDARKLRVTLSVNGGSVIALSPDETIGSVPQAWVAETVQGYGPESFIKISGSNAVIPNGNGLVVNGTQVIDSSGNWTGGTVSGSGSITSPVFYGSSSASGSLTLDSTSNGTKGNIIIAPNGGNVGIGTTAPANALDINGGVAIGSYAGTGFAAPTGGMIVSGNVGIGNTGSATATLSVGNYSTTNSQSVSIDTYITNPTLTNQTSVYNKFNSALTTSGASGSYTEAAQQIFMQPTIQTGMSNTGTAYGLNLLSLRNRQGAATDDNGSLTSLFGESITYGHSDTLPAATPQTTTAYGLKISPYIRTGTIGDMYDLYLDNGASGGTISGNHFAIYQNDTTVHSWLGGSLGMGPGNSSPVVQLDVRGAGGAPASTGTTQTGVMRLGNTSGSAVLDFGNYTASPFGSWLQSTKKSDLSTLYPLALNPNGGNVGIGNTSPGYTLDVQKNSSSITPNFPMIRALNTNATQGDGSTTYNYAGIRVDSGNSTVVGSILSAYNSAGSYPNGVYLRTTTSHPLVFQTNSNTRMMIDTSGNVGIGTTAPSGPSVANGIGNLDVVGSVRAFRQIEVNSGGSFPQTSKIEMAYQGAENTRIQTDMNNSGGVNSQLSFWTSSAGTIAEAMRIRSDGNVGIGVTNPSTKLQVAGEISPSADNTYTLGDSSLRFSAVYATNGTIQTSDARFKEDIRESDLGLDFINQLRPVSYRWKSGPDATLHYGLIAQEAEKAVQDAHAANKDEKTPIVDHDEKTDRYGLRYTELISPLIKSVQELYQRLTDLETVKAENAKLKQENAEIKARLDRIERTLSSKP